MTTATKKATTGLPKGAVVQGQVTKLDPWGLRRLAYPLKAYTGLLQRVPDRVACGKPG